MSKFWQSLLGQKPVETPPLPDPFDVDLEDAYLDGPSALAAEKSARYYKYPYNSEEWKAAYERQKKWFNTEFHPPKRPTPPPFDEDPAQAQYYEEPKKGKPFDQWEDGVDFKQTAGYVIYDYKGELEAEYRAHPFNVVGEDKSTQITYAYCQKGHLHAYNNGNLVVKRRWGGTLSSKHYPETPYLEDSSDALGWADKTIKETPYCE